MNLLNTSLSLAVGSQVLTLSPNGEVVLNNSKNTPLTLTSKYTQIISPNTGQLFINDNKNGPIDTGTVIMTAFLGDIIIEQGNLTQSTLLGTQSQPANNLVVGDGSTATTYLVNSQTYFTSLALNKNGIIDLTNNSAGFLSIGTKIGILNPTKGLYSGGKMTSSPSWNQSTALTVLSNTNSGQFKFAPLYTGSLGNYTTIQCGFNPTLYASNISVNATGIAQNTDPTAILNGTDPINVPLFVPASGVTFSGQTTLTPTLTNLNSAFTSNGVLLSGGNISFQFTGYRVPLTASGLTGVHTVLSAYTFTTPVVIQSPMTINLNGFSLNTSGSGGFVITDGITVTFTNTGGTAAINGPITLGTTNGGSTLVLDANGLVGTGCVFSQVGSTGSTLQLGKNNSVLYEVLDGATTNPLSGISNLIIGPSSSYHITYN